jgi:hypothetical protein
VRNPATGGMTSQLDGGTEYPNLNQGVTQMTPEQRFAMMLQAMVGDDEMERMVEVNGDR